MQAGVDLDVSKTQLRLKAPRSAEGGGRDLSVANEVPPARGRATRSGSSAGQYRRRRSTPLLLCGERERRTKKGQDENDLTGNENDKSNETNGKKNKTVRHPVT